MKNIFLLENLKILSLVSFCFFIGILDDSKVIRNAIHRFFLFIILIVISIVFFDIKITSFGDEMINSLNENYIFSLILVASSLFAVSNGANLIDGFNGLLLLHTFLINFLFAVIAYASDNVFIFELCLFFQIFLVVPLILNFPKARLFMGDSGAYLCGSFLGMVAINLNTNLSISPFFLAVCLSYLVFEIFFSILRKIYEKKNPFSPDNMHLHLILYKRLKVKNIKHANYKTSLILLLGNSIFIIGAFIFYNNILITKIIFIAYILIYSLVYFLLRREK